MAGTREELEDGIHVGTEMNHGPQPGEGEVDELNKELDPEGEARRREADAGHDDDDAQGGAGDEDEDRRTTSDEEIEGAANDAEREAIRARRRKERQDKKERERNKTATLQRQLADERAQRQRIEQRLHGLERANVGSQLAQLKNTIAEADQAEATLKAALATAASKNDGATVAEATTRLQQLSVYRTNLQQAHDRVESQATRPQQQHVDPKLVENANNFRKKHPWFKGPNAADPDSRVLGAIDNSLTAEGWDPATDAYWEELETRAKKYLPDRFTSRAQGARPSYNSDNGKGSGSRSTVAGSGASGASSEPGGRKVAFNLSADRVRAMKEAGIWDDPVRKADMIKRYRDQDAKSGR